MKIRLYCRFIPFLLLGFLLGTPSFGGAQSFLQMPWEAFDEAIDSLNFQGNKEQAIRWTKAREAHALQMESWENMLACVNKYCRLIEVDEPNKKVEKLLASRWIADKIQGTSSEKAEFTQQLAEIYLVDIRNNDSVRFYTDQALAVFIPLGMWENYAYTTIVKGLSYYFDGKYDETEKWWMKGLDSATLYLDKNSSAIPTVLNALGALYTALGDYDKSLIISKRTLDTYEQMGSLTVIDSQFLGVSYINRGHNLMEMEDYEQALDHFRHAKFLLSNLSQRDPADMILAVIHEGMTNWKLGKKEKAFGIWMEMLEKTENHENYEHERMVITVYLNLSEYYLDKGENDKALDYLLRAYELGSIEKSNISQTLLDIGSLYLHIGNLEQAKIWLDRAWTHAQETFEGRSYQVGAVYLGLAEYFRKMGDSEKSLENYQLALIQLSETFDKVSPGFNPSLEEVNNKILFLKVLQGKANLCKEIYLRKQGQNWLNLAAQTFELAILLIDDIRTSYRTEGSKLNLAETAQGVYDGAIQVAMIRYKKNPDQNLLKEAFSYAERNKGLSLREALQESDARQFAGIPAKLLDREHKLKSDLAFYGKKIFDADPSLKEDSLKIVFWQTKQFELRQAFLGLIDTLEKAYPAYYELKYRDESIKAEEVMQKLKPGSALVEYFWGEEELVVFFLSHDAIEVHSIEINELFWEELNTLRNSLAKAPSDLPQAYKADYQLFCEISHSLYQKLVAPVVDLEKIDDLLIIPDGALGYIPFEVLITSPEVASNKLSYAELSYLFNRCKLRYEYAAAFLDHSYNRKRKDKKLLGFAPVYGENIEGGTMGMRSEWQALRYNQDELQEIYNQIGGKTYLGENATKSHFLSEAPDCSILHLAMHGFINDKDPLYSGLVFSPEPIAEGDSNKFGLLYAYELYSLSLQAELAVLSACNTGNGQLRKGEGIMSMARAFRYAGCPSIVMSLWTADDRSTIRLMEFFYKNLAKGMEKDAALQAAREEYFASTRRDHPYYWAGFVLIGEEDVLSQAPLSKSFVMIGGAVLLSLFLFLGARQAIRKRAA